MSKKEDALIIIGGGLFQLKSICEARKLGLKVLVFDRDPEAFGRYACDFFETISTRDIDAIIESAKKYKTRLNLRGVFTAGTDAAYTVASVADALKLPGILPEVALLATNKYLMRLRLAENQVPVPKFRQAANLSEAILIGEELGFPLVIKPVDNMGARGVRKISSKEELNEQFGESLQYSGNVSNPAVILEEYLEGDEISMDTLVQDGEVFLLTVADRHIGYPPYFVEYGHSIPSRLPREVVEEAFQVMQKAIRAIGIDEGAAKADIRITKDGPFIGEITARLSGGFHSQVTEYLATGMNSTRAAIKIAIGEKCDLEDITPQWNKTAIERAIILEPGTIQSIHGVEEAKKIPGMDSIFLNKKVGDKVLPIRSNLGKVANLIAVAKTREEAEAIIEEALGIIRFEMTQELLEVGSH